MKIKFENKLMNISNEHLYVLGYEIDKSLEKEGLELKKNDFFQRPHFFYSKNFIIFAEIRNFGFAELWAKAFNIRALLKKSNIIVSM